MNVPTGTTDRGINGSRSVLGVDRAMLELRQGRAIALVGDERTLVVAALEAISEPMLEQLLASGNECVLLLTTERAQAAELNADTVGPVAVTVRNVRDYDGLRRYAGMAAQDDALDAGFEVATWDGSKPLTAAGFRLAKAARLIPALIGFEVEHFEDDSVEHVTLGAIRERAELMRSGLVRISESRVPLADAEDSRIMLFRDEYSNAEHVAVVVGDPAPGAAVPVRMHSACLTGDVLGSLRCDCGEQLHKAVLRIAELGAGVLLYLDQEGRGIGLANKLRAYAIQDSGLDTLDADRHLGFSADERAYDVAAAMLHELGITRIEIMTNNPLKIAALKELGIDVAGRLPLVGSINEHNESYLRAKRERAGHVAEDSAG